MKDWKAKASPRASPKLKRKGKKDDGYAGLARIQVAVGPAVVCLPLAARFGGEAGQQPSAPSPQPVWKGQELHGKWLLHGAVGVSSAPPGWDSKSKPQPGL